ncbi:hypothetical protein ACIB24_22030 [Spongisporangium articulatum]|uniref:Uncharacterized protein n=1 Tax=Spongisporangium articulatum TaxID=3362603 RepID=A0ABW8AVV4_9ACTN
MPQPPAPTGDRPSWTDREDQLQAGFREIACTGCDTRVLVRKMHPAQTSTQWHGGVACEFLQRDAYGTPAERCPVLTAAIDAAVSAGTLPTEPTESREQA